MNADHIIGRTVREVRTSTYGDVVTLVLDDGTHYRLTAGDDEYNPAPIDVRVLDGRLRVAEVIDRRVREYEAKVEAAKRAERAEAARIVRERMKRNLSPAAYREWVRRHQPGYLYVKALKTVWTSEALERQIFGESPLFAGVTAHVPVVPS